jgi:hypothetical protein
MVIFVVSKGSVDVILSKIDLIVCVGRAKVHNPEKKRIKGRAKRDWWLSAAVSHG